MLELLGLKTFVNIKKQVGGRLENQVALLCLLHRNLGLLISSVIEKVQYKNL